MPFFRSKFRAHVKAHKTVISNERWFQKGPPFLGKPFTVKKTVRRHAAVIKILSRAGKRAARAGNDELADAYRRLQAKLTPCRPRRRCGSSACPKCARAFQRAKVEAEQTVIADSDQDPPQQAPGLCDDHPATHDLPPRPILPDRCSQGEPLAKGCLGPPWNPASDHRQRGSRLGKAPRPKDTCNYIGTWPCGPTNPDGLEAKLKVIFLRAQKYERPVDVRITRNLGFLGYKNKIIKLPKLLRHARRQLAELSLLLDQIEPFDFLFLRKLRLSAQSHGVVLRKIK